MDPNLRLRPITAEDAQFLRKVYRSTREEELAGAPWTEEQKAAFFEMQFVAQHTDYHRNYPDASFDVIVHDNLDVGRLYVHRHEQEIAILDIALLPAHRRAGIGGTLLRALIAEADAAGLPVIIYVEKYNRALSLYQRLGFVETDDTGVYWRMVHSAPEPNELR